MGLLPSKIGIHYVFVKWAVTECAVGWHLSLLGEVHSSAAAIFGSIVIAIEGSEARSFIYLNPGWTVQKYISGQKTI